MTSVGAGLRLGTLAALALAMPGPPAAAEIPSDRAALAAGHAGALDTLRIPIPVPVPVPARRPGAPPPDASELQEWREARAEVLARARLAMLPPPGASAGVVFDAPIVPPVPRIARRSPSFIMPFENGRVSSTYNRGRIHPAIDLAGRHGTPVMATSRGQVVTFAGWYGGYGKAVITRDREGRMHLYGHLSGVSTKPGVVLAQGERIGALGSTGYSTGPHVHYEVKDASGRHIDPATLLFPGRVVTAGFTWTDVKLWPEAFASRD
ncbi:MAG: M23 family metallopeptidase [Hyphomicrobiaceae bacterium]|nr:M23 family metallopeptidase [Hyphomicrobiaceae bacterium]